MQSLGYQNIFDEWRLFIDSTGRFIILSDLKILLNKDKIKNLKQLSRKHLVILTYASKLFVVHFFNMGPISLCIGIDATSKFSITQQHVFVVTLCVNASTACFSCLRKRGFSLYTSALAAPQKKSTGARSELCEDHLSSACKLQILFPNNVRKWTTVACAVWGVALFCWNHKNLFWFGVYSWLRSSLIRFNTSL